MSFFHWWSKKKKGAFTKLVKKKKQEIDHHPSSILRFQLRYGDHNLFPQPVCDFLQ